VRFSGSEVAQHKFLIVPDGLEDSRGLERDVASYVSTKGSSLFWVATLLLP
jgi:hypothetical protein